MKLAKQAMLEIIDHIRKELDNINSEEVRKMINTILFSKRVFVCGAGRSELVAKAFAMRLSHLDIPVFVVGETITPPVHPGDVLLVVSGSGSTSSVVHVAKSAKKEGAKIIGITSNAESEISKIADRRVIVKGRTKIEAGKDYLSNQIAGKHAPLSPLGTLFEDTCQVFLDGIIVELMNKLKKTDKDMMSKHANIE